MRPDKMRVRSRRVATMMLIAGVALVAFPVTAAVAQTEGEAQLGVFDVSADANGIGVSFGNPGAQPYPVAAGLVPHASTQFGSGPAGYALSSIMWPGPLAANAGTLAALVGVPLPPDVLAAGNYPVRAEAAASGGGRDEKALGPMSAVVDGEESTARTALSDFSAPALVSAARVVTKSRSFLDDGQATAVAETVLQEVEIGGVIHIETVRTLARGITDGTQATLEHEIVLSGVTVQGQGATIDHEGLHLGGQDNPSPLGEVAAGANQALTEMGMEAFVTTPVEQETTGGAGTVDSGAVVFVWKLGDSGQQFVVVLGGARAHVQATPGSAFDLGLDGDFGGGEFSAPTGGGSVGGGGGGFSAPTGGGSVGGSGDGSGAPSGGSSGSGEEPLSFLSASSVSDRVPYGWMIIGALGMGLIGMGLHGLRARVLDASLFGATCPLERGAS